MAGIAVFASGCAGSQQEEDPYLWLEEVEGQEALAWVEEVNEQTLAVLKGHEVYQELFDKNLAVLNSSERIPAPSLQGDYIYNFWQDAEHVRGIWRRTPKADYLAGNPRWETVLDIDKLSAEDGENWVFKGGAGLPPDYSRYMLYLSRGGADAVVIREFDMNSRTFVEGGFELPEAKGNVSWVDENTLLVASDFGEGTLTTSGYARQVKLWDRGSRIEDAPVVFEGEVEDVRSYGSTIHKADRVYTLIGRALDFFTRQGYALVDGQLIELDIPLDADVLDVLHGQFIISLKSDWEVGGQVYGQGALVSLDYDALLEGRHDIRLIAEPDERSSIGSVTSTRNYLLVTKLNNVISELYRFSFGENGWTGMMVDAPGMGTINLGSTDNFSDDFFFYYQNFLTPSSLYQANAATGQMRVLQSMPAFFDASGMEVWQYEVASKDGTMIPYFVVGPKDMEYNGKNPTLLAAYGGFEVPRLPGYSATIGNSWLETGGVYVLANIRGGGEFGPRWHQAGLKENRQRVFDDFHAVAEDLIERGITSGRHLGIQGGSNGGLLVGVAFTQRPELYNAVVCQVPLLDMQRYNKLLAGASWMGEYGNPDIPEEWEYIRQYSPYHNLEEGQDYPEVFFTTSTRDDRVHPGHARKMVAKMTDMGYNVYYFENMEGGHGGASTNEQRAMMTTLGYAYLHMKLAE
jgi:prolyl oligopeptidase